MNFKVGTSIGIPGENNIEMITIILFLALLITSWVIFKSIDWFEKI
ncbi:hypothetical protein [Mucilaginibacter pedocola]|nr:hypothetical protein [Mucilaginibacter pedocola]